MKWTLCVGSIHNACHFSFQKWLFVKFSTYHILTINALKNLVVKRLWSKFSHDSQTWFNSINFETCLYFSIYIITCTNVLKPTIIYTYIYIYITIIYKNIVKLFNFGMVRFKETSLRKTIQCHYIKKVTIACFHLSK